MTPGSLTFLKSVDVFSPSFVKISFRTERMNTETDAACVLRWVAREHAFRRQNKLTSEKLRCTLHHFETLFISPF